MSAPSDSSPSNTDSSLITELISANSVAKLESMTGLKNIHIETTDGGAEVYSPWMTLILITGVQVRVTLKTYFKSKVPRNLVAPLLRTTPDNIKTDQALEFMREYCNLMAGGIKKSLSEIGFATGTSFPVVSRGFDELFFLADRGAGTSAHWLIKANESEILMSAFIELFNSGSDLLKVKSESA